MSGVVFFFKPREYNMQVRAASAFLSVMRQNCGELPELKLLWCLPTICLAQVLGSM